MGKFREQNCCSGHCIHIIFTQGVLIQNSSADRSYGLSDDEQHTQSPKRLWSHTSWCQYWPHTNQLQPTCSNNLSSKKQVRAAWLRTLPAKYSPGLYQNSFIPCLQHKDFLESQHSWIKYRYILTNSYSEDLLTRILTELNVTFPSFFLLNFTLCFSITLLRIIYIFILLLSEV